MFVSSSVANELSPHDSLQLLSPQEIALFYILTNDMCLNTT